MDIDRQIEIEKNYAQVHQRDYLCGLVEDFKDDFINAEIALMLHVSNFEYKYEVKGETKIRQDLVEIRDYFQKVDFVDLFHVLCAELAFAETMTIQRAVGTVLSVFDGMSTTSRKLKAANLVLLFCPLAELEIRKGEEYSYIHSLIELDDTEWLGAKRRSQVPLPSIVPLHTVTENHESGYFTHDKSVLLGGKHHEEYVNLSHINRCNSTPLKLDRNMVDEYLNSDLNQFDPTPKYNKKTSRLETKMEVALRQESHNNLAERVPEALEVLGDSVFYNNHEYCNRGRTYCEAYAINYQGKAMSKALVDIAEDHVIPAEF